MQHGRMKTPFLFGAAMAVAGTLVALAEYLLGYHNDISRFDAGQRIGMICGFLITVVGLIFAMRNVRDKSPDGSLSYGKAVGTGALTSVFQGLVGGPLTYLYGTLINPEFHNLVYEIAQQKVPAAQADAAAGMLRFFSSPLWFLIAAIIVTPIMGTVLSLIIGAFMKRAPRPAVPPPLSAN